MKFLTDDNYIMCDRPLQLFFIPPRNLSSYSLQSGQGASNSTITTVSPVTVASSLATNDPDALNSRATTKQLVMQDETKAKDSDQSHEAKKAGIIDTHFGNLTGCQPPCQFM